MNLFSRSFIRKRAISLATTVSFGAISFALAQDPTKTNHVGAAMPIPYVTDRSVVSGEQSYLSENAAVMKRMMAGMAIKPTGDVDRDFVAMMAPHNQGAIDMENAELNYGNNEQLRRLAQEIVAKQQQKITAMRDAIGERSSQENPRAEFSQQSGPADRSAAHSG